MIHQLEILGAHMSDAVTPTEDAAYWSFVFNLIRQRLSGTPPDTLWHYTDGGALIEITKSGSLFATQIACVNDTTEFRYSIELLRDAFVRHRPSATSPSEIALLDYVVANISTDTVTSEWFVTCFSTRKDDLSQWRAYSGGENGCAIGFDARALLPSLRQPANYYLGPVNYDASVHAQIVDVVAAATVRFFLQGLGAPGRTPAGWMQSFLPAWANAIGYIAPVIKHPAFKDEDEWRIFHPLRDTDPPHMIYRQKRTLMSRHLPLRFFRTGVPDDPKLMPIAEIMIGPSRHKNVSRTSVGDLMRTRGYGSAVAVTMSNAPFQEV
jgi:hypothetical protein